MFKIEAIRALTDNYIWLLSSDDQAIVIDPGESQPVLDALAKRQLQLQAIFLTHHHQDHTGGVSQLKTATGARVFGPALNVLDTVDQPLKGHEKLQILGATFHVWATPGHTLDHLVYYSADAMPQPCLFSGDTLFSAGCGRLFEGDAKQLFNALAKLRGLPPSTQLYCAHEYTLSNLAFAQAVEPSNERIRERISHCQALRKSNQPTLPSTIALELETNPFLRYQESSVKQAAEQQANMPLQTPEAVIKALRRWKDRF